MRRSKPICAADRPLRRMLFLSPVFAAFFLCLWAAYTAVLPLSTGLSRDCSNIAAANDAACAEGTLQAISNAAHVSHIVAIADRRSDVRLRRSNLPQLKLEKPSSIVPSKPFVSVDAEFNIITVGGDDKQEVLHDGVPVSNPRNDAEVSNSPMQRYTAASSIASNPQGDSQLQQQPALQDEETANAQSEVVKVMGDLRRFGRFRSIGNESSMAAAFINPELDSNECDGKRIFIYDLPTKFNVDLLGYCLNLMPWQNMCDYFSNSGMGRLIEEPSSEGADEIQLVPAGLWYKTHQYALEIVFHERLKQYKCLTTSTELADMFYIPYYGGIDVLRWHFVENASTAQRDELAIELIRWLKEQPSWGKYEGADHVLVLGKITWDFRRMGNDRWGSSLLLQEEMQKPTKLLIERQPWYEEDVAVPHPTFFHPRHDRDIRTWQNHIDGQKRTYLVSFAGQPRPNQTESIRSQLIRQCLNSASDIRSSSGSPACHFLDCGNSKCMNPKATMDLFMHSEFCMQPSGDSPTRRSVFDSLIAGCIPVLFDPYTAYYQYPWHLPADPKSYSVYFPADDVREGKIDVVDELMKISSSVRQEMRRRIIYEIMPGLVYGRPDARFRDMEDAFTLSIRALLAKISDNRSMMRAEAQKR